MEKKTKEKLQELGNIILKLSSSDCLAEEDALDIVNDIESALALAYHVGAVQ